VDGKDTPGVLVNVFVFTLILWACIMFVLEIEKVPTPGWIEHFLNIVFTIEYILRAYGENPASKYLFSAYGIIDFWSIVPYYIAILRMNFVRLGFLRAARTARALKFLSFIEAAEEDDKLKKDDKDEKDDRCCNVLKYVSKIQLSIIQGVATIFVVVFVFSGMIVSIDPDAVEESFYIAFYFIIVTITTVGYGDYSPTNAYGQGVMAITILICMVIFSMQIQRISKAMDEMETKEKEEIERRNKKKRRKVLSDRYRNRNASQKPREFARNSNRQEGENSLNVNDGKSKLKAAGSTGSKDTYSFLTTRQTSMG